MLILFYSQLLVQHLLILVEQIPALHNGILYMVYYPLQSQGNFEVENYDILRKIHPECWHPTDDQSQLNFEDQPQQNL